MVIQEKNKERITISFSGSVGEEGLMKIKNFIEFLEKSGMPKKKKVSQALINKLADEITSAAWERLKKERGLKFLSLMIPIFSYLHCYST